MADYPTERLNTKEARQGTRPSAMVWVLLISTLVAAALMYLILVVGWTGF